MKPYLELTCVTLSGVTLTVLMLVLAFGLGNFFSHYHVIVARRAAPVVPSYTLHVFYNDGSEVVLREPEMTKEACAGDAQALSADTKVGRAYCD